MRLVRLSPVLIALGSFGLAPAAVSCNALLGTSPPGSADARDDGSVEASEDATLDGGTPRDAPWEGDVANEDARPVVRDDSSCSPTGAIPRIAPDGSPGPWACDAGADAGSCGPSLLIGSPDADHGLFSVYGVAVSGGTLYGTDYYHVPYSAVFRGSTTDYVADPQGMFPQGDGGMNGSSANLIVTDGSRVYFAVYQDLNSDLPAGIYSIDPQGRGGLIASTSYERCLLVDSSHLYWAVDRQFWRADKDGGHAVSTPVPQWSLARCVLKGGRIYYASVDGGIVAVDPADPATALAHYSGPTHIDGFDVGSSYVFWADATNQAIYRAPLACPGTVEDITPPKFSFPRKNVALLTDDQWVYVFNTDLGQPAASVISRFRTDGSTLQMTATLGDAVTGIDQDSTALYFGTYGGGLLLSPPSPPFSAVWKLAK